MSFANRHTDPQFAPPCLGTSCVEHVVGVVIALFSQGMEPPANPAHLIFKPNVNSDRLPHNVANSSDSDTRNQLPNGEVSLAAALAELVRLRGIATDLRHAVNKKG
jgi:hypothetical protein